MKYNLSLLSALAVFTSVFFASCDDGNIETVEKPNAPYLAALGITSSGTTTYYVVTTEDLMTGTIDAIGQGIEQNGYRDYEQFGQTVFSIGGRGVNGVYGVQRGENGLLKERGEFVFDNKVDDLLQTDADNILSMELPASGTENGKITFRTIGIKDLDIRKTIITTPVFPLNQLDWPSITGVEKSGNYIYVTYTPMNPKTYMTAYTDTTFVAVYNYPEMSFKTLMKDTRFGPGGSWSADNGLIKTESGDLYVMSNSSLANGYSQATKKAGFLRIPAGTLSFDPSYTYNFEEQTDGLKPAHVKYIGNGLVYAEVSTIVPQSDKDRWGDKELDCYIIDLYNKTAKKIKEIPRHAGVGGRRFVALVEGNYVYAPISTEEGTYIYRTNVQTATGERGAKVSTTFVAGLFKLK